MKRKLILKIDDHVSLSLIRRYTLINKIGSICMIIGLLLVGYFFYQLSAQELVQKESLDEAVRYIETVQKESENSATKQQETEKFEAEYLSTFGTLTIPKLNETLGIVEGADSDALHKGVGHMQETVYPGQGEQIILAGHRDTVFRNFDQLEIGDRFIINMPYGEFSYEIKHTKIVSEHDTTIVGEMGQEVLLVSTCYPFSMIGDSSERFIAYAYPINGL